jgi:hypothetical protein
LALHAQLVEKTQETARAHQESERAHQIEIKKFETELFFKGKEYQSKLDALPDMAAPAVQGKNVKTRDVASNTVEEKKVKVEASIAPVKIERAIPRIIRHPSGANDAVRLSTND